MLGGSLRRGFVATKGFAEKLNQLGNRVRTKKSVTDMKRLQGYLNKSAYSGTLKEKVNRQASTDEEFSRFLKQFREKNKEHATILDFSRFFDENNQLKDNEKLRQDEIEMLKEFHKRNLERKEEEERQVRSSSLRPKRKDLSM